LVTSVDEVTPLEFENVTSEVTSKTQSQSKIEDSGYMVTSVTSLKQSIEKKNVGEQNWKRLKEEGISEDDPIFAMILDCIEDNHDGDFLITCEEKTAFVTMKDGSIQEIEVKYNFDL